MMRVIFPGFRLTLLLLGVAVAFAALWFSYSKIVLQVGVPTRVTGYALFASILLLGALSVRKRFPAFPIGAARYWLRVHWVVGIGAVGLFVGHVNFILWPRGFYEQGLAIIFLVVCLSGFFGFVLQVWLPPRITAIGSEEIFERIPARLASLRVSAETLVLEAVRLSASSPLGDHYVEQLNWYFSKPRFLWDSLLDNHAGMRWVRDHIGVMRRYVGSEGEGALAQLEEIALKKCRLDSHYALQGLLKCWTLVHVPSAVLLVLMGCWHLVVVNVYAI